VPATSTFNWTGLIEWQVLMEGSPLARGTEQHFLSSLLADWRTCRVHASNVVVWALPSRCADLGWFRRGRETLASAARLPVWSPPAPTLVRVPMR
jgi:hypothetical protein